MQVGSLGGGWLADAWGEALDNANLFSTMMTSSRLNGVCCTVPIYHAGRRYALLASDISFILGSGLFLVRNSVAVSAVEQQLKAVKS